MQSRKTFEKDTTNETFYHLPTVIMWNEEEEVSFFVFRFKLHLHLY